MLIKEGDSVEVIAGNAATRPRHACCKVDRVQGKVLVEGVNLVYKHVRRSQKHPQGGRLSKEMPIDVSNVMYCLPDAAASGARLGARFLDDGSKERFCKKCGAAPGKIAPAKAAYAKAEEVKREEVVPKASIEPEAVQLQKRTATTYGQGSNCTPPACRSNTRRKSCRRSPGVARPHQSACRCRGSRRSS